VTHPFALPARLSPDLTRVHAYWRGLLRGSAQMPFWDDFRPTDLPDLADRIFLVDVFQRPERFRLGVVGRGIGGESLGGLFLDESPLPQPFAFLRSQCAATVEAGEPTLTVLDDKDRSARLVLPMWGDGRISMLLGAVDRGT
jgi:hypothetical protein